MNAALFQKHREQLMEKIQNNSFALFYAGSAPHKSQDDFYEYAPNRNFFYLTGLQRENFILLLVKDSKFQGSFLFIEEPSDFATKWFGRRLTKEEASEISGIDIKNIRYVEQFKPFLAQAVLSNSRQALIMKPTELYLDLYRPTTFAKPISMTLSQFVFDSYPEISVQSVNEIIDELRMIKDEQETAEISQAIEYERQAIEAVFQFAKPGMNERQVQAYYEYSLKMAGSAGVSFESIVASGQNGTVLHYRENNQTIQDGSLVLLDLGGLSNLYASDISRTFPVNGTFSDRQKQIYEIVLKANKQSIEYVKPGISWKDLNLYAKNILATECQKIGLIKELSEIDKYYYHSVSHFLGLDVHDVGHYIEPLRPGIVLTIEPGLYIEEEGIGIRIEDNVLVTETGHINLSQSIIKEVSDIESFMKSKK